MNMPRPPHPMIDVGESAPTFTGETQDGDTVSLSDFSGQKLVLYFYPKDDTPGCTTEACGFRDELDRIREQGAAVVGVSADTAESHREFAGKYGLDFPLVADPDGEIIEEYGVEGRFGTASRVTFLIDEEGVVEAVYDDVDPDSHAAEILEAL